MVITVVRCKRVIMSKGWVDGWGVCMEEGVGKRGDR